MPKLLLLMFFVAALTACDDNDNMSPAGNDTDSVLDFLRNDGGLIITLLTDDDDDETDYFESYIFFFNADGTVDATDANGTVSGTYSVYRDDGRIELDMDFPPIQNFSELDDDWYFISINQNTIRFADDDEILVFQQQ